MMLILKYTTSTIEIIEAQTKRQQGAVTRGASACGIFITVTAGVRDTGAPT